MLSFPNTRKFKQQRFWAMQVNRKSAFFSFTMPRGYHICIAKCFYSYTDELPENLIKTTAEEFKKSTSGLRASLKNVVA